MKQRKLRRVFGKKKLKSVLIVELSINGITIRTLTQIEIEEAIMNENSYRFKLACSSLVFNYEIMLRIGVYS